MATTEEKLRQREIGEIKHKNKLKWWDIITNPLTFIIPLLCAIAFLLVAWYFDCDYKKALIITATHFVTIVLEFFVIKYFDKK